MTDKTAHVRDNNLGGDWLRARPGEQFLIRIPASATDGSYSVTEVLSDPGDSTPVHIHEERWSTFLWWKEQRGSCTETKRSTPRRERWLVYSGVSNMPGEIPPILPFA